MTMRNTCHPFPNSCASSMICIASVFAILAATPVQGADWQIQPMIRAAWNVDDNATLNIRTDQEEEISGPCRSARVLLPSLRRPSPHGSGSGRMTPSWKSTIPMTFQMKRPGASFSLETGNGWKLSRAGDIA